MSLGGVWTTVEEIYAMFIALLPESQHKYVQMYHTNADDDIQKQIFTDLKQKKMKT